MAQRRIDRTGRASSSDELDLNQDDDDEDVYLEEF
jgi:hypothetical protein